ncbi:MAG TPA: FAD-linked oxidase C-terminal domain-containing protein [Planctomycetota bacterium]|jgi:FAD/FMN-containing dehydrogenase/Fe-S oxidoreductase
MLNDLKKIVAGEVRLDAHNRMLYSTDASIYQVEPLGVVIPADIDDLLRVISYCGPKRVPLLPRGGGTSLPGQCVNRALVVDYSPTCRQVLSVEVDARTCHVEPGITIDELNRALDARGTKLFFAPDPATSAQASIGGSIGNNAAGARSIRYGRTSENVAALDVALSTGERLWLEPGAGRKNPVARRLAEEVSRVVQQYAPQIRERFPKTNRRNAGYALDSVLAQLDRGIGPDDLDLTCLLCGSEGTLAVTLGAKLKLHPVPRSKGLAICSFATLEDAIAAVAPALQTGASAVELIDDVVLTAARRNTECRGYMDLLPKIAAPGSPLPREGEGLGVRGQEASADPMAVLYVEYQETGPIEDVHARFEKLRQVLPGVPLTPYIDQKALMRAWALRKAGEPLLHGLSAHRRPITCVEDNAVPVENLARFVAGFKEIVTKHGTKAAYWAHASVGVLHVRPMLDLHDPADRDRMRGIAVEVADLARQCGGIMSGEHGDGRLRGPLLERFFGAELMQAFRQVKAIFDPAGILNPGNITVPGPVESMTEHLRVNPHGPDLVWPKVDTFFDYSNQEGFAGAIEMCNGAGVCRKTAVGVMCPSYRATMDERHATRGRANALRLAITGQLSPDSLSPERESAERAKQDRGEGEAVLPRPAEGRGPGGGVCGSAATSAAKPDWNDAGTIETLSLCLSCKACKTECPSNVDVARLKAEYTAQRYAQKGGAPIQARVFGQIRLLNALGSMMPNLANFVNSLSLTRAIMNPLLGLAPQRTMPRYERSLYNWFKKRPVAEQSANPKVVLFGDCFVTYNEPRIGQAAVRVLEALGYQVELPEVSCCGRAMISTGLLEEAIRTADRTLEKLRPYITDPQVKAIVVCEPSCLATMKDEWLQLKLKTDISLRKELAAKAIMVDEFIERDWEIHPTPPSLLGKGAGGLGSVVLHSHCHQKAIWGEQTASAFLKRLVGERLSVLPSGCCGMAGSFGYKKENYELSMKIGEQSLFSLLKNVPPDAIVLAPGTSCRHQIHDGTARTALHPIELAAQILLPQK